MKVMLGAYETLQKRLNKLEKEGVRAIKKASVLETKKLISQGFRFHRDPYGKPWAPQAREYGNRLMDRTGKMRKGFSVSQGRNKSTLVVIKNRQPYTKYHQTGTRSMPARKMVPDEKMPNRWKYHIARAAKKAFSNASKV